MSGPPGIVMSGVPGDPGITVSGVPGEPGLPGMLRQRVADWSCPGAGTRESGIDWAICFASSTSGAPSVISTSAPLSSSRSFAVVTWTVIAIRVSPGAGDGAHRVCTAGQHHSVTVGKNDLGKQHLNFRALKFARRPRHAFYCSFHVSACGNRHAAAGDDRKRGLRVDGVADLGRLRPLRAGHNQFNLSSCGESDGRVEACWGGLRQRRRILDCRSTCRQTKNKNCRQNRCKGSHDTTSTYCGITFVRRDRGMDSCPSMSGQIRLAVPTPP